MQDDNKLARWLNNEMEEAELREFTASAEFETYRKIRDYSAMLTAPDADLDTLYIKIEERKNRKSHKPGFRTWIPRVAAILVIAIGLTWFFHTNKTTTQVAGAGKHIEFNLPDNSEVVLNAGSKAEFKPNKWDNKRAIELEGEAYFKVAKGNTFDVKTKLGTVTVVGTQFNVRERNNRLEVNCYEGKVKVSYKSEIVYLLAGENVVFENGENINVPANDMQQPGWLTYETTFTAEKPENVISELERQYNVNIKVSNSKLQDKPFTGTIPMKDLDSALKIIETLYHLKSEKKGNTIILSAE